MAFEPLTIPPQQMHVFGLAAGEKARPRFIDHCWEQFPDLCEELGEDEVARLVRAGMAKAAENGYDTFADTLSIVEMTVVYGENFEETEAWVRPIWEAAPPRSQARRPTQRGYGRKNSRHYRRRKCLISSSPHPRSPAIRSSGSLDRKSRSKSNLPAPTQPGSQRRPCGLLP